MARLYEVYVEANAKSEAEPNFFVEAKRRFAELEAGTADSRLRGQWSRIREVTVDVLKSVYARLNIHFDHYHGEAMYGTTEV